MSNSGIDNLWLANPIDGDLVIIGVANRQKNRKDEIKIALDDAARKAALFYGIKGTIYIVTTNGSNFEDYSMVSDYDLEYDTEYEKYSKVLVYDPDKDVFSINGALLVCAHFKLANPLNINYNSALKDGMPEWIRKPPNTVSGYLAGIGYARPRQKFQDTVFKSYENAIASIINRISTQNLNKTIHNGGSTVSADIQVGKGELAEFFVIEMWHDKETNGVWVLALAKQK